MSALTVPETKQPDPTAAATPPPADLSPKDAEALAAQEPNGVSDIPKSSQEPAPRVKQEPPPGAEEGLMRLLEARARTSQKSHEDDRGQILREAIVDPDDAMQEAAEFLGKYIATEDGKKAVQDYLAKKPVTSESGFMTTDPELPPNWALRTGISKSTRTRELEDAAKVAREQSPAYAAFRDYVVDPLGNILPAAAQVLMDTAVGAINLTGADLPSPNVKEVIHGWAGTTADELRAIENTASGGSTFVRAVGTGTGMGLGFMTGIPGLGAAQVGAKAGKALLGTVGKAAAGKVLGHSAGTFAQFEFLTARDEKGHQGSILDLERLKAGGKGLGMGAAMGVAQVGVSKGLQWLFKKEVSTLGPDEKRVMEALRDFGDQNKLFRWKNETEAAHGKRLVTAFIDADLPGVTGAMPKKLLMYAAKGGADSVGISLLDQEFRKDLTMALWAPEGATPEEQSAALGRVVTKFGANAFGNALLHMPLGKVVPFQRRPTEVVQEPVPPPAVEPAPPGTLLLPETAAGLEQKAAGESLARIAEAEAGQRPMSEAFGAEGGSLEMAQKADARKRGLTPQEIEARGAEKRRGAQGKAAEAARHIDVTNWDRARYDDGLHRLGWSGEMPKGEPMAAPAKPLDLADPEVLAALEAQGTPHKPAPSETRDVSPPAKPLDLTDPEVLAALEAQGTPHQPPSGPETPAVSSTPAPPRHSGKVTLEGTPFAYEARGDTAIPNQSLREQYSLPESMPLDELLPILHGQGLVDSLSGKAHLNGQEVSLGQYAVPSTESGPGEMTMVRGGKVYRSPISFEPDWKPVDEVRARTPDHISQAQQALADKAKAVLSDPAIQLDPLTGKLVDGIVDVLTNVAAEKDPSVAESLPHIEALLDAMKTPEGAAGAAKALAEMLTIKSPPEAAKATPPDATDLPTPDVKRMEAEARSRDVARRMEGVAPAKSLRILTEELDAISAIDVPPKQDRSGERGSMSTEPIAATARGLGKVGSAARRTVDFQIGDQAKVVARRGGPEGEEFARKITDVLSDTRFAEGQAKKELRGAFNSYVSTNDVRESLGEAVTVKTQEGKEYPGVRYAEGIDGRLKGRNAAEQAAFEAADKFIRKFSGDFAKGGGMVLRPDAANPEKVVWVRATERDRAVTPRVFNKDADNGYDAMLRTPAARAEHFQDLVDLNPHRKLTVEGLERDYRKGTADEVSHAERQAALEKMRIITHMPASRTYAGKKWQLLESDVVKAMNAIAQSQAPRVAMVRSEFGQDLPKDVRQREGITKPGITESFEEFVGKVNDPSGEAVRLARKLVARAQGKEPNPAGLVSRIVNELAAFPRAVLAWKAFAQDVGSAVTEPLVYGDFKTLAGALAETFKPRAEAEDIGTLQHELGNLNEGLSDGPLMRAAEFISEPSSFAEGLKTKMFDGAAKTALEQMRSGKWDGGDKNTLQQLGFTKGEQAKLLSDSPPEALQRKFRHAFVRHLTSRGRDAEGSEMAASPSAKAWVNYTRFATKHLEKLVGEIAQVFKAETLGDKAHATGRLMKRLMAAEFSGLAGTFLYYLINDAFKGEFGGSRFLKEFQDGPGTFMLKAGGSQILAGPFAMLARAAMDDQSQLFKASPVTSLAKSAIDASTAIYRGAPPIDTMTRAAEDVGAIPREIRAAATAIQAGMTGTREQEQLDRKIGSFKFRHNLIDAAHTATKPNAYYAAMRDIEKITMAHKPGDGDLFDKIKPALDKALELTEGDKAGAKIDSMKYLRGVPDEMLPQLTQFLGDADMKAANDHDAMIGQLARQVGRLQGTPQTAWTSALETAEQAAKLGGNNVWNDLMDRAIEAKVEQLNTHEPSPIDLDELAEKMALYPEGLARESSLGENDRKRLARVDHLAGARILRRIMLERAIDRRDQQRREAARKALAVEQITTTK